MNSSKYCKYISLGIFSILVSCTTDETKIDKNLNYVDFIRDSSYSIEVDSSISTNKIKIPSAQRNSSWKSSNFSLTGIPENLSTEINLDAIKVTNYNVHSSSGGDTSNNRNIVSYNDTLFTMSSNLLYAYDLSNIKSVKWKQEIGRKLDNLVGGGIYADGEYIAASCGGKEVSLFNASNGNKLWSYNLSNISRSAPLIYKNHVFINTIDNTLHAINLKTGFLEWAVKEAHETLGFLGTSSPVPFNDTIIIPFSSGKLSAININTGQIIWSASLSLGRGTKSYVNDIDMVPVIRGDTVYLSSHNGILYAINATNGTLEWANDQAGGGSNQLWVADDYVYSINKSNQLLAVYKVTGTIKWIHNLELETIKKKESILFDRLFATFNGPTMINGNLYIVSSDGHMIVVSATSGEKIKDINVLKSVYSPALSINNQVYLLNSGGTLSVMS